MDEFYWMKIPRTTDDRWLPFAAAEAEALEKAFSDLAQSLFQRYIDFEYFKFYLMFEMNVLGFILLYIMMLNYIIFKYVEYCTVV